MFVCCLYLFQGSEHTFVRLHQVHARHLFAVCGELINTQVDAPDFVRVGGSVGLAEAEAQPEACTVVSSKTLPLKFVGVIEHVWPTPCLSVHKHTPSFLLIVCVCVCVHTLVPGAHFNSVSISLYLRDLMAERHARYPAHPTPETANELLLYTLMKYNCIMVCK